MASDSGDITVRPALEVEFVMTELPRIRPQEMKIIGRCVHFRCDKPKPTDVQQQTPQELEANRRYFEGMVAHITRDTVVLLDVEEFTFQEDRERRAKEAEQNPEGVDTESRTISRSGDPGAGLSTAASRGSVFTNNDGDVELPQQKTKKILPYVTFNRKKIRDVEFAPEVPTRCAQEKTLIPNEQRLRMYVRRYIVHTSVNNNPTNITLHDFIKSRTKWQNPSVELLKMIAEEEFDALLKVDEEIMKQREARQARNESRRAEQAGAAAGGAGGDRRNGGRMAAHIPFGDAGALYNTGIPARTSYVAVAHLAVSITMLLYSAASFSSAEQYVIYGFISQLSTLVSIAGAIALFLGGATGYHALKMKFPINMKPMFLRIFFLLLSTAFLLTIAVMLSIAVFGLRNSDGSLESHHESEVANSALDVCNFNVKYKCSGYDVACPNATETAKSDHCPALTQCQTSILYTTACKDTIVDSIKDTLLPITILSYISIFIHGLDWLMLQRMFKMVSSLTESRARAGREPV